MDVKLQIKIASFNGAMADMSRRLKRHATQRQIVDGEVGKILEAALKKTDTATVASIRLNSESKEWTTYNGKKYNLLWRYPNELWSGIKAMRKADLMRRIAARGLTKRSFHALGLTFGQNIKAPAFVQTAVVPGHTSAQNVASQRKTSTTGYGLRIENHSPILRYAHARQAFFAAVAGRVSFFTRNLAKGVFNDLKQVQAKYPGIRFTP